MKPYLLSNYDHMAYSVVDRQTGESVGYVLAGFTGWYAYSSANPGRELAFGEQSVHGFTFPVDRARYRADAAERVWQEHERMAVAS